MKTTISSRQTAIIASIIIFANKILTLPSLLFEYGKGDSFLLLMMMLGVDIAVLFAFFAVKKKYQTESFFEVLSLNLGKVLAVIIYVLLLGYYFVNILLNFNISHIYFNMQVYHNDQITIFLFVFFVILMVTTAGGLRSLSRTVEFFYYAIIVGFLFCLFISFTNFNQPLILFDADPAKFFEGAYRYVFTFGDFLLLFLIMDKIELKERGKKQIFGYVAFSIAILLVEYFLFYSIFQHTGFMHTNALSDIIVLSYQIFDIGRLDIIAVVTVMLLSLCQNSLYAYVLSNILRKIFPKMSKNYSIFIVILVFFLLYALVLNSLDSVVYVVSVVMPVFAILLQYVLPFSCLLFRRKEKKVRGGRHEGAL